MPDCIPPIVPGDSSPTAPAPGPPTPGPPAPCLPAPCPVAPCPPGPGAEIAVASAESVVCRASRPAKRLSRRRHPLPDAVAVRSIAVPQAAPPYDDDQPEATRIALDSSGPGQRPPISGSGPSGWSVRADALSGADLRAEGPERRSPPRDPASHWPSKFAQVLAETLAGSRPPSQIAPWTTEQARRRIGQLGPMLATAHRPRVIRVIVTSPVSGVLELAVIVALGTRVRALAARLERVRPAGTDPAAPPASGDSARLCHRPGQPGSTGRPNPAEPANPAGPRSPGGLPDPASGWLCTAIEAA